MRFYDEGIIIDPKKIKNHPIMEYTPKNYWDGMMHWRLKEACNNAATKKFKVLFCEDCTDAFFFGSAYRGPGANGSGSMDHWYMYLAYELMFLVDEKKFSVEDAWDLVCFDSQELFRKEGLLKWKSLRHLNVVARWDVDYYKHYWMDIGANIGGFPLAYFTSVNFTHSHLKTAFCVQNCED